jgi:hypothetical protein
VGRAAAERTARAEGRAALLARAGAALGASLDHEQALGNVARLIVPVAADRFAVDLVEDGGVRRVAEGHDDGAGTSPRPDHDERVAEVARTGEPVLQDDTAILPLTARGRTVGVLTLASAAAPPAPDSLKLAFARELAAECATAIDNARLHLELRASEEALRRSNDQLGAILGGVADGVLARDAARSSTPTRPPRPFSGDRPRRRCAERRSTRSRAGCGSTTRAGASSRPATFPARAYCRRSPRPTGCCASRRSTPAPSAGCSSRRAPSAARRASCASCC